MNELRCDVRPGQIGKRRAEIVGGIDGQIVFDEVETRLEFQRFDAIANRCIAQVTCEEGLGEIVSSIETEENGRLDDVTGDEREVFVGPHLGSIAFLLAVDHEQFVGVKIVVGLLV